MPNLYYIHDPMCSWCYAFGRVLKQVELDLPKSISITKIVGGLAPDSIEPMPKSLADSIQQNWKRIEQTVTHVKFNFDFWKKNQPIRSTYPSCRAVLAAKKQSSGFEDKMISQIQWAYYKNAENPSLDNTLINCAKHTGLDETLFIKDYKSKFINEQLYQQIKLSRQLGISSYPSLCLQINTQFVMIKIDYNDADFITAQLFKLVA